MLGYTITRVVWSLPSGNEYDANEAHSVEIIEDDRFSRALHVFVEYSDGSTNFWANPDREKLPGWALAAIDWAQSFAKESAAMREP